MEIKIFDVAHGACAMIFTENGGLALIDCGHDPGFFTPTSYLRGIGWNQVHHLVISNFDQDHVSDLHNLLQYANVHVFHRNQTVTPYYISTLKLRMGPITSAMSSAIWCLRELVHPVSNFPDMGCVQIKTFCNNYPDFTDTNNLSVVTFVTYENFTVVFPGDLEEDGWLSLLENPQFRAQIAQVNVFVASHHGRVTGYCSAVFDYCSPDVIVISDKGIVHGTQQHDLYSPHAKGIFWPDGTKRQVLTTRNDGTIKIVKVKSGNYTVYLNQ